MLAAALLEKESAATILCKLVKFLMFLLTNVYISAIIMMTRYKKFNKGEFL